VCLANVYIEGKQPADALMEEVAWITAEEGGLRVTSLFGESLLLQARVKSIDLMESRVVLEEVAGPVGGTRAGQEGKGE